MSCNYADGLSPYEDKGKCGLPEIVDDEETVFKKVKQLAEWMKASKHVVIHTGAGISTTAGIPDFRGPNGVWTLESKGVKPNISVSFDSAKPTLTHMALVSLQKRGFIHYIISQNVDGLHLKSGYPRSSLSELHGNMFIEQCDRCGRQFVRGSAVPTVGQKCLNKPCPAKKAGGRSCRGKMCDNILDWEHELPSKDLELADKHSKAAELSLCLGSTLQIIPSGNLPLRVKENNGKLVICNLQPTKHDSKANLIIHSYVDFVISLLCKLLDVEILDYTQNNDPTFLAANEEKNKTGKVIEWTIPTIRDQNKCKNNVKRKYEELESWHDEAVDSNPQTTKNELQTLIKMDSNQVIEISGESKDFGNESPKDIKQYN